VHAAGHVACLDKDTGALLASGTAARPPVLVAREDAIRLPAPSGATEARLVWKPCAATLSMFDPLWRVEIDGREVFVDQRGRVWPTLPPKGPGGGPG